MMLKEGQNIEHKQNWRDEKDVSGRTNQVHDGQ